MQAAESTPTPPWFERVSNTLRSLLDLAPNWDSYGAPKVDEKVVELALIVLLDELPTTIQEPIINPTPAGGVQIEWHRPGANAEVEFVPGGEILGYLERSAHESEAAGHLHEIRPLLAQIGAVFSSAQ